MSPAQMLGRQTHSLLPTTQTAKSSEMIKMMKEKRKTGEISLFITILLMTASIYDDFVILLGTIAS